jgi:hypothetical protein
LSSVIDWTSAQLGPAERDVGHCRLNLAVLYSVDAAERFLELYETEAGRFIDPIWELDRILAYDDTWPDFVPKQVAGRMPLDLDTMTSRVEHLLELTLARL